MSCVNTHRHYIYNIHCHCPHPTPTSNSSAPHTLTASHPTSVGQILKDDPHQRRACHRECGRAEQQCAVFDRKQRTHSPGIKTCLRRESQISWCRWAMIICREKWRGRPPRRLRRARPTWISSDLHNSTNQSSDGLFSPTPSRDRRVHSSHSNLLKPKHMVFSRRFFCFNRIRWCQINGHEKSFDLMCISEKVN